MLNYNSQNNFDLERKRAEIDKRKLQKHIIKPSNKTSCDSQGNQYYTNLEINNFKYSGGIKDNKLEGYGISETENIRYEGYFTNNIPNGYANVYLSNGIRLEGRFTNYEFNEGGSRAEIRALVPNGAFKIYVGTKAFDVIFDKGNIKLPNVSDNIKEILLSSIDFLNQDNNDNLNHNILDVKNGKYKLPIISEQIEYNSQTRNLITINGHGNTINGKRSTIKVNGRYSVYTADLIKYIFDDIVINNQKIPNKLDIRINACDQYELSTPEFRKKIAQVLNKNHSLFNNVSIYFHRYPALSNCKVDGFMLPHKDDYSYKIDFIKQKDNTFEPSIRRDYVAKILEQSFAKREDKNIIKTRL